MKVASVSQLLRQRCPEVRDRPRKRILEVYLRFPFQQRLRPGDVRPAHLGIVQGKRVKANITGRTGKFEDQSGNLDDGQLSGVPDVDGIMDTRLNMCRGAGVQKLLVLPLLDRPVRINQQ